MVLAWESEFSQHGHGKRHHDRRSRNLSRLFLDRLTIEDFGSAQRIESCLGGWLSQMQHLLCMSFIRFYETGGSTQVARSLGAGFDQVGDRRTS